LLDAGEPFVAPLLRDLENLGFGGVEQIVGGRMAVVGLGDDRGGGLNQPAENRLVFDDLGVELDVGRGGNRVDQLGQILQTAGGLELPAAKQLVPESDVIDD